MEQIKKIFSKRAFVILSAISLIFFSTQNFSLSQDHQKHETEVVHASHSQEHDASQDAGEHEVTAHEEGGHEGGSHGGMEPLFFVIVALIIGAATHHFLKKSPLPFTVSLLLIGLGIGVADRFHTFDGALETFHHAVGWAANIDPHLILYVFLPILIFEAAFAMDVHTFKKSSANAIIMAVPGIIVAILLTAALSMGLKHFGISLHGWEWGIALMFGAVASATDPVAVVALLKDLGASKKLGTLIEGESLLNDGTAIVIFMVILTGLTGLESDIPPVLEFFRVSAGGIFVGLIIGWITIRWVKKVFNDALVEISVVVAAAYLVFFVAEHFLHVSGVLGLVAFGLMMASVGRTRISPEVEHFLHEFWELAAFIANTLIFLIVGVVIAERIEFTANDFLTLGIIYIGIHVVRAIVIALFYPIMKRLGYGLPKKDAYIVWYGALRGAIGLALALVVAGMDDQYISPEVKGQFLFLTAGIVTLTLLINATTVKFLVNALGLTDIPPAKALMIQNAKEYLRTSAENNLERLKADRYLSRANWSAVSEYLPQNSEQLVDENIKIETIAETRRRVLQKEKSSYWHQFKDGMLSSDAVRLLSDGINEVMDAGGMISLAERKDLEELWHTPKLLSKMQNSSILGKIAERMFFNQLSTSYDCARGFVNAQEECLKLVESMVRSAADNPEEQKNLEKIEEEINENRIHGLTFLRNLRKKYPEIYTAIATRQAIRSALNYERHTVERLQNKGQLESDEAKKMTKDIEIRMKRLMDSPPTAKLPKTHELLKDVPWLKDLEEKAFNKIAEQFQSKVHAVGNTLIKEGDQGDSLCVIARGTAKVSIGGKDVDILGSGAVLGEISVLTGLPRTATIVAESPVTALWIKKESLEKAIKKTNVEDKLWEIAGKRLAHNLLQDQKPYNIWRKSQFEKWLKKGEIISQSDGLIEVDQQTGVLLQGQASENGKALKSPAVFKSNLTVKGDVKVIIFSATEESVTA